MERLERLVVHVEEALRLAHHDDVAHMRVALLLLDSAAELTLHRAVQGKLAFQATESQLLTLYERAEAEGHVLSPDELQNKTSLREKVLSRARLRQLERNFNAKAEFLVACGDLPDPHARALRKLHAYRNEAHHRDEVRPGSLRSAVSIYSYLVCTMMRDLQISGIAISLSRPEGLKPYIRDGWPGFDTHAEVAAALLDTFGVAGQEDLGAALANHLLDRLQAMLDGLDEIVAFVSGGRAADDWDQETALILVQLADRSDRFPTPKELRRMRVPMSMQALNELQQRARQLADERDQLTAFAEFADVEDAFESVETRLQEDVMAIDRELQLQMDMARGK